MSISLNRSIASLRLLLCALLCVAPLAPLSAAASVQVRNALGTNGDFEYDGGYGLGEGWSSSTTGDAWVTPSIDATSATMGQHSQRFGIRSYGSGTYEANTVLSVGGQAQLQRGDTVHVSLDLKTSYVLSDCSYNVTLECLDSAYNPISSAEVLPWNGSAFWTWTKQSATTVLPSNTSYLALQVWISTSDSGANGTLWLDNVVVDNGLTAQVPVHPNHSIKTALTAFVQPYAYDWYEVARRFDMVVVDRSMAGVAHTLKLYNPNVQVYLYALGAGTVNRGDASTYWPIDYNTAAAYHPEWFLKDAYGDPQTNPFYPNEYNLDPGLPSYQRAWRYEVLMGAANRGYDGIFIDNVAWNYLWLADSFASKYEGDGPWDTALGSFLGAVCPYLRGWGLKTIGNLGESDWNSPPFSTWLQSLNGGFEEDAVWGWGGWVNAYVGQDVWTREIQSPGAFANSPYVMEAQVTATDQDKLRFALASYLIARSPTTYFAASGGSSQFWQWSSDLEALFGAPVGPIVDDGGGLFSRDMANGLVLANGDSYGAHAYSLSQAYTDLDGNLVGPGTINVAPLEGMILFTPGSLQQPAPSPSNPPVGGSSSSDTTVTPPPVVIAPPPPPTGPSGTVVINGGTDTAYGSMVTLDFSATGGTGGPAQVAVKNDGDSTETLFPYATSLFWTLSPGAGPRTVDVQFIDAQGNRGPVETATITVAG